ncbi:MAG: hypothetical protein AAGJ38_04005 [Planctomycetota bacterium]
MASKFPPRTQKGLYDFGVNATSQLETKGPAAFGLSDAQASEWVDAISAYNTLYTQCQNPTQRTPSKVEDKRTARAELIRVTRKLSAIVQAAETTTDTLRRDLGLPIRDTSPTPIPAPQNSPVLTVSNVSGRTITFTLRERLEDGEPSERRGKPEGVAGANVFYATGETAPTAIEAWTFVGGFTRTTESLWMPESVPAGANVWLTAQWFNRRQETGPGCPPILTSVTNAGDQRLAA